MKLVRTEDAIGHVLCHDMTQILPGDGKGSPRFKGPRFKKGHVVTAEDVPVLLSMGSGDLPNALKIWFARASSRAAVRAMVAAETLLLYFIIAFSSHSTMDLIPQRETTSRCACLTLEA